MSDAPRCVYCRARPAAPEWRPFCSERCKLADLGRWLTGSYRVAGAPAETAPPDPDDGEDEPDSPER
ncbi:MAG TPA: DNA gyrase inhibitor YacG [Vicinamibacterales bacterium]|nr:DNA gyrase inhibitor YacG [Vicinamibacterales bacterium]